VLVSARSFMSFSGRPPLTHRAHPDLHSFPTRRSSDLITFTCVPPRRFALRQQSMAVLPAPITSTRSPIESTCPKAIDCSQSMPRSEEHTSELQSREKLVCRLLLEKKNSADSTITNERP